VVSAAATASTGSSTTAKARETQADVAGDGTASQIVTNEDSSSSESADEARETRARVETTEQGESVQGERTTDLADGPAISENTGADRLSEELAAGPENRSTLIDGDSQDEDTTALLFALIFVVVAIVALFIWLGRRSRNA
jgi:cobalamin biosynthesis Mg chelatase CobN